MTRLKNPLMSFLARGKLGSITFKRSRKTNIAEKTPVVPDAKSSAQLAWRTMYQACVDLWHTLSAAEKVQWESDARPRHMTGYAWYLSQCLRPNPGIYLPLAGGTMAGQIAMATNSIIGLPLPTGSGHAARKSYVDALIAAIHYNEGARAFHNANQNIANATLTTLAFNSERWDNDTIHDNVVFNSRLTCKTAGKYLITANTFWQAGVAGWRQLNIRLNGVTQIAVCITTPAGDNPCLIATTIYDLAVTDYVEVLVYQTQGVALNILAQAQFSPEFEMFRIGS